MGWFGNLFGRKAPPVIEITSLPVPVADLRGKGEAFEPGDLAICIADCWMEDLPDDPKRGDLLHVSHVQKNAVGNAGVLSDYLSFREKSPQRRWCHTAFRKVEPRHEKADLTVEEMIKGKKVVERTS